MILHDKNPISERVKIKKEKKSWVYKQKLVRCYPNPCTADGKVATASESLC